MRRLRLYWRLLGLVPRLMRYPEAWREVASECEAIHRDLGHDYDASVIRPEHRGTLS